MKMTKLSFKLLAVFLFQAMAVAPALAGAPLKINFQGRLEQSGQPAEGSKSFVFKIYDAVTGGTEVWSGDAQAIDLSGGVFSAVLSSGTHLGVPTALSTATFSGARYVEIIVDGVTLAPRQEMVSAPYAMVAQALAPDAVIPAGTIEDSSVTDAKVLLSTAAIASGKFGDDRVQISTGVISGLGSMALEGAEADPVFTASAAAGITVSSAADWNEAHGWGDHSVEGYASLSATQAFTGANVFTSSAVFTFQHGSDPGVMISSGLVVAAGRTGIGTAAPNSVLSVNGAMSLPVRLVTSDYAITEQDSTILVDATGGDVVVTLPPAGNIAGRIYTIKLMDTTGNAATIGAYDYEAIGANETIESDLSVDLTSQFQYVTLQSGGLIDWDGDLTATPTWIVLASN